MTNDITLSASRIKLFTSCERKYYYEYVEEVKKPKHPAALVGSAVHKTIERVYREFGNPIDIFHQCWDEQRAENPETVPTQTHYNDGIKMVTRYEFAKREPLDMEVYFKLPFPNKSHPICYIQGYIDHIYDEGLVDLKTSKRKPLQGLLNHDPQFIIYGWAYEQLYGKQPELISWHHLRTGEDIPADVLSKDKLSLLNAYVNDLVFTISDQGLSDLDIWWPKRIGEACIFCSHRKVCLGVEN